MKKSNLILFFIALVYFSLISDKAMSQIKLIDSAQFGSGFEGKQVEIFTLRNVNGVVAQLTNFGGRWLSSWVPDKDGKMTDVVLGFNNIEGYIKAGEPYHGAITGRICGRINNGKFILQGTEYILANNDGFGKPMKNHLHGGINGFHRQVWNGDLFTSKNGEEGVIFKYSSVDGEEGFPGNLKVQVKYLLSNNNEMIIEYEASTDKPTIVNITNHSFFNLNGEGNGDILNQKMKIYADKYVETDQELIPTGRIRTVEGTPLDYREFSLMGKGINSNHDQIFKGKGYAAAMVVKNKSDSRVQKVAEAYSDESGIKMEVYSDQPSLQIYNAWFFDGNDIGKQGKPYIFSGGFVLETQGFPDAPNHKHFPSIVLNPEEKYKHFVKYVFK